MSLQKCANLSDCESISACATDTPIFVEIGLSYPILSSVVSWLFSMFSGEFCLRLKPYLVVEIASDVLTEHCCQVCIWLWCFAAPTAGWVLACVVSDCAIRKLLVPAYHVFWPVDTPTGQLGIWKIFFTFDFHILPEQRHICARIIPCRCIWVKKDSPCWQLTQCSRYSRPHARSLKTSWWLSATKTVKFFVAHTVNCVICNNHTIIDWMLWNFTPVIQPAELSPTGPKVWEIIFRSWLVDRLSCQLELSKSETSQFRSDLAFDIVNCVHVIFLHGGLMLFWDLQRVQTSVLVEFYGPIMCQNRPDVCNIIPINHQITARLFHILQHMPCD